MTAFRDNVRKSDEIHTKVAEEEKGTHGRVRSRDRDIGPGQVFGETGALDGVDLTVPAGTVYGVLCPKYASKLLDTVEP